jgi:hypothetical protein
LSLQRQQLSRLSSLSNCGPLRSRLGMSPRARRAIDLHKAPKMRTRPFFTSRCFCTRQPQSLESSLRRNLILPSPLNRANLCSRKSFVHPYLPTVKSHQLRWVGASCSDSQHPMALQRYFSNNNHHSGNSFCRCSSNNRPILILKLVILTLTDTDLKIP